MQFVFCINLHCKRRGESLGWIHNIDAFVPTNRDHTRGHKFVVARKRTSTMCSLLALLCGDHCTHWVDRSMSQCPDVLMRFSP